MTRAELDVMKAEAHDAIEAARAALEAAFDRKHAAIKANPRNRPWTRHPDAPGMNVLNADIDAAMQALDELEEPISQAEFDLRWAEHAAAREARYRSMSQNYCCLDYTDERERRADIREHNQELADYRPPWQGLS